MRQIYKVVLEFESVNKRKLLFKINGNFYGVNWDIELRYVDNPKGESIKLVINGVEVKEYDKEKIVSWVNQLILDIIGSPIEP